MKQPVFKPRASIFLTSEKASIWRTMDDVVKACKGKPVKISGTVLDLNDCQIVGTKLPQPKNDDDEGSIPLRINIPGFTLCHGSTRGIPGGILFREKGARFLDLLFLDIGEDGLSNIMDDSEDAIIRGCSFWGASDKSVQLNDARGLIFEKNDIHGGITGVRLQKKATKYQNIKTRSLVYNRFFDVDTAWNCSGAVLAKGLENQYHNVRLRVKASSGAKFTGQ